MRLVFSSIVYLDISSICQHTHCKRTSHPKDSSCTVTSTKPPNETRDEDSPHHHAIPVARLHDTATDDGETLERYLTYVERTYRCSIAPFKHSSDSRQKIATDLASNLVTRGLRKEPAQSKEEDVKELSEVIMERFDKKAVWEDELTKKGA